MKQLLLLLGLLLASGCDMPRSAKDQNTSDILHSMRYFKDPKTGLCFASVQSYVYGYYSTSITCVPCEKINQ